MQHSGVDVGIFLFYKREVTMSKWPCELSCHNTPHVVSNTINQPGSILISLSKHTYLKYVINIATYKYMSGENKQDVVGA